MANSAPVRHRHMRLRNRLFSFLLAAVGPWWAFSAQAQFLGGSPQRQISAAPPADPDSDTVQMLLHARKPSLLLEPGDSLSVQVFEVEKYDYKTRIASDGTISLPLVDAIGLQGKTVEEAEAAIADRLQALGMIKNPHVHVTAPDQPSEFFTVAGDVNKPGTFPAYGSRTLLAAISQAGGLKEDASRNVTLLRQGAPHGFVLNLGSNPATSLAATIPVFAGDTVAVGTSGVIYVVGAVKLTGAYKLKSASPTTVEQAVTLAGGPGFEADWSLTEIVRVVDGKHVQMPIDLKKIMHGTAPDPVLQADDILFIPSNALRAALKANGASLAVSLTSAALLR